MINNKEKMTSKTTKILAIAAIFAFATTMIAYSNSALADTELNKIQGETIIADQMNPIYQVPNWAERNELRIQKDNTADEIQKRQLQTEIDNLTDEIRTWLDNNFDESKHDLAMSKKSLLTDKLTENRKTMGQKDAHEYLPSVGRGYDYVNNSLRVEIDHRYFEESNLKLYEQRIRDVVGYEVDLTMQSGGVGKLQSGCDFRTTDECEPIKGGVAFDSDDFYKCTVGFKATYDGDTGFVTAGHCVDGLGNHDVNQAPLSSKDLGNIEEESYVQYGTFPCDCAFISVTHPDRSMDDGVFDMFDPATTANPIVDMTVTMSGAYSELENGDVTDINFDLDVDTDGDLSVDTTIEGTGVSDYTSEDRDSGSPVMSGNSLVGIHIGYDPNDGDRHFNPHDHVTTEFSGLSWGF